MLDPWKKSSQIIDYEACEACEKAHPVKPSSMGGLINAEYFGGCVTILCDPSNLPPPRDCSNAGPSQTVKIHAALRRDRKVLGVLCPRHCDCNPYCSPSDGVLDRHRMTPSEMGSRCRLITHSDPDELRHTLDPGGWSWSCCILYGIHHKLGLGISMLQCHVVVRECKNQSVGSVITPTLVALDQNLGFAPQTTHQKPEYRV